MQGYNPNWRIDSKVDRVITKLMDEARPKAAVVAEAQKEIERLRDEYNKKCDEQRNLIDQVQKILAKVKWVADAGITYHLTGGINSLLDALPEADAIDLAANMELDYVPVSAREAAPPAENRTEEQDSPDTLAYALGGTDL